MHAVFLQATRGQSAENVELVYYNVGRESVEIVYQNVPGSAAEAEEEEEYHLYEEIDLPEAGSEAGPSEETEYHQYTEIDLPEAASEAASEACRVQ